MCERNFGLSNNHKTRKEIKLYLLNRQSQKPSTGNVFIEQIRQFFESIDEIEQIDKTSEARHVWSLIKCAQALGLSRASATFAELYSFTILSSDSIYSIRPSVCSRLHKLTETAWRFPRNYSRTTNSMRSTRILWLSYKYIYVEIEVEDIHINAHMVLTGQRAKCVTCVM